MLVEQICRHCNKIFVHDGQREASCPNCIDPHLIPGESYKKQIIIDLFRRHLRKKGVHVASLDNEAILSMMTAFPRTNQLYHSNANYLTVTLPFASRFQGKRGEFELLLVQTKELRLVDSPRFAYFREIKCLRCNRIVVYSRKQVLEFYIGLVEKCCIHCDHSVSKHDRDTTGLNRNGSEKSEYSDRAMAKALNISRNDYRRHKNEILSPVPSLPLGTIIGNLSVVGSYWDENPDSYSPKYILQCTKCNQAFECIQKRVALIQHFCQES